MRKTAYGTVKVRAIAGTYVIFLAFDMHEAGTAGLMGFAIQRVRLSDGETIWLSVYLCAASSIAFLAVLTMPETRHVELTQPILK